MHLAFVVFRVGSSNFLALVSYPYPNPGYCCRSWGAYATTRLRPILHQALDVILNQKKG